MDYYEEYIHRHADVNINWIDLPNGSGKDRREMREATGVGILSDGGSGSQHMISPLDDGSICVWDVTARSTMDNSGSARLVGQSMSGLLTGRATPDKSRTLMTETGAVECVSINSSSKRGYLAVQDVLQEVDLETLQVSSTKKYTFPITALSTCQPGMPLTVGTHSTVHLHDPREPTQLSKSSGPAELIGGRLIHTLHYPNRDLYPSSTKSQTPRYGWLDASLAFCITISADFLVFSGQYTPVLA